MAWLSGWGKRVTITISHAQVDANLTHFPLMLELGTSVGTGNADVSCIFDELASDDNRTKIAVTKDDGTTELYVEIEKWNDANEVAILWVSKSDWVVAGASNTIIYLYYDADHAANTTYVADAGGRTEVWDSNFWGVYHMGDLTTSTVEDSTSNSRDGAKKGANEPTVTTSGKIASAQTFDGSNDYIDVSKAAAAMTTAGTVSFWLNCADYAVLDGLYAHCPATDVQNFQFYVHSDKAVRLRGMNATSAQVFASSSAFTNGTWHFLTGFFSSGRANLWVDGAAVGADQNSLTMNLSTPTIHSIGRGGLGGYTATIAGTMDEVRISNVARADAWVKADYYSQNDGIAAWGAEELALGQVMLWS